MKKILILVPLLSIVLNEEMKSNLNPKDNRNKDDIKIIERWDREDSNIKNIEYKNEIEKLKNTFANQRQFIINDYNKKIEPLKRERENSINNLRKKFTERRKEIRNKYGIKNKKPIKKVRDKNNKRPKEPIAKPKKKPIIPSEIIKDENKPPVRKPTN